MFFLFPLGVSPSKGGREARKKGRSENCMESGQVRPRQGTEICNFGAPSPLEAVHWIFCFFSSIYVQFSKTSPLKSGESSENSSGENRVKSCHVCGCRGFFGPDRRSGETNASSGARSEALRSVKVRRGRRGGDGTENVMTERPSHAHWFCA